MKAEAKNFYSKLNYESPKLKLAKKKEHHKVFIKTLRDLKLNC